MNSPSPVLRIDPPDPDAVRRDVRRALEEDIGTGDATADLLPSTTIANARVITREDAVVAGRAWFDASFKMLDASVAIDWNVEDGARAHRDDSVVHPARTRTSAGQRANVAR